MKHVLLFAALLGVFGWAQGAEAQTLLKAGIQIKNTSAVTISYQFRWRDLSYGDWVAPPGQTRYFWITFYSNTPRPQASIRFDRILGDGVPALGLVALASYIMRLF